MKILIISEYFAPVRAVASIRWTKIGKYLAHYEGCTVDLLTNQKVFDDNNRFHQSYQYDETLANDLSYINRIYEFRDTFITNLSNFAFNFYSNHNTNKHNQSINHTKPNITSTTNKKPSLKYRLFYLYTKTIDIPRYKKAISLWKKITQNYDVIISSYGPRWPHLVAENIKKSNPNIIWIADYRDSMVFSNDTNIKANREFPSKHTGSANCISFIYKNTESLQLPKSLKTLYLSNGFDPSEITKRKRKKTSTFYISITGSIYNNGTNSSDLTPLINVLDELIDEGSISKHDVVLRYCGKNSNRFLDQTKKCRNIRYEDLGFISREDAMIVQDESSILSLSIWNSSCSKGILTGRIYEYIASGVPILGLCSGDVPNSALADMIKQSNSGFCYEEANGKVGYQKMKVFIKEKYEQWKNEGTTNYNANYSYIDSFRHDNLAHKLFIAINQIKLEDNKIT